MRESLLDTEYQYIEKKNSLETQLKTYATQLSAEIQSWEITYAFIASIAGKITFTNYWVENQNVTSGEEIFNIIPVNKGTLIGKASLPTTRSGKVKIGQTVNVRFDNFPENEFGIVRGKVQNISLVPSRKQEENRYVVDIAFPDGLRTTYNKELPYLPEMQAQADIITDDLSLLERFFLPIKKVITESL
jgi:HlyD family secretion protein